MRKAQSYSETIRSKEQLLLVTGLRSFSAQPIFSGDEHSADKFKMERFLHAVGGAALRWAGLLLDEVHVPL